MRDSKPEDLQYIAELQAEIESLQRQLHNSKLHEKECYEARRVLSMGIDHDRVMTRAEAIKEFAERLKSYLHQDDFNTPDERWKPESEIANLIDQLVIEMVGERE